MSNTKEIYIKYDYGNKVVSDWERQDNILFIEGVDVGLIQAEGEKDGIFYFKIFGGEYNFMCEKQDDITKWNQKRLNAIKEVIQWVDSGKQGLNNGMEEIDFIVNEWNFGNNLDLSEEDVKTIIETNENPPEPNEKLKEAFKTYNMDKKRYTEGKQYKVDIEKIETIEDVKSILKFMDLHFTPQSKEEYKNIKHLLKEVPY